MRHVLGLGTLARAARAQAEAVATGALDRPRLMHEGPAPGPSTSAGRGAFILFEGVDRCGKTTQSHRLVDHLQKSGTPAELWRFPDRTTAVGKMIDSYLKSHCEVDDATIHLLFAANRWEKRQQMLAALASGTTLVVDRYAYSGVAFTAAKSIPGLDIAWCKAPDAGLPAPDAVLYLDLPFEEASKRGGFGRERYESEDMQRNVAGVFAALQGDGVRWHVMDATQAEEAIAEQTASLAAEAVKDCRGGAPLRTLWGGAAS